MRKMEQIVVDGTDTFYRGTGSPSLNRDISELGVWFSDNKRLAETFAADGYVVTAHLQARRPVFLSANKSGYGYISIPGIEASSPRVKAVLLKYLRDLKTKGYMDHDGTTLSTDEIWAALREKGYDAVIISDVYEGHEPRVNLQTMTVVAVLCAENVLELDREQRE